MVSLETPICDFGAPAVDFALPGVDGKVWTLDQCRGEKGLLVMFICNHCPYVKAIRDRLLRVTRELLDHGINSVAIRMHGPLPVFLFLGPMDKFVICRSAPLGKCSDFIQMAKHQDTGLRWTKHRIP